MTTKMTTKTWAQRRREDATPTAYTPTEYRQLAYEGRQAAEQQEHEEALARGRTVSHDWCECPDGGLEPFYYERPSGLHGWACTRCHRIVQTG